MVETIARRLARFVADCGLETLPAAVLAGAKLHCLDTLMVALAGASAPSSQIMAKVADTLGGREECTVIGWPLRTSPLLAALVNGASAHAIELDDDHRTSVLHPGAVVIPAAFAMAEHCGASGRTLLEGVVAGYEITTRIGDAFLGQQYYEGFHATGTCGVFGAAAAAGRILGLDLDQLTAALGIAGTQAAGLGEWRSDGSWIKRLHPGKSAEAGILAALLAQQGFSGPSTILEGEHGFLKAFSFDRVWDIDKILDGIGHEYRGHGTSFKPYASCRFSHQVVDAALSLFADHAITAEDIVEIAVRIHSTAYEKLFEPTAIRYRPNNVVDAQFSIPYIIAIAALHGRPMPQHFTTAIIKDPAVLKMAARVTGTPDSEYEKQYPMRYPTMVSVRLRDGREHAAFRDLPSGDPENPRYSDDPALFENELLEKFDSLLRSVPDFMPRRTAILTELAGLEHAPVAGTLVRLFAP